MEPAGVIVVASKVTRSPASAFGPAQASGNVFGKEYGHGSFCAWKYGDSSCAAHRTFTLDATVEIALAAPKLSPGF